MDTYGHGRGSRVLRTHRETLTHCQFRCHFFFYARHVTSAFLKKTTLTWQDSSYHCMSKPLKVVQYGLGVVKRNWSIPSATQEPRCSPSPIPLNPVQPAARKLTGSEHQACTSSEKAPPGRKLPHWQSKDFLLKSNLTRQSRKTTKTKTIRKTPIFMSSVREIAPVSLSQEQIQILKLVEDGNSIFYTGSAGMRSALS